MQVGVAVVADEAGVVAAVLGARHLRVHRLVGRLGVQDEVGDITGPGVRPAILEPATQRDEPP